MKRRGRRFPIVAGAIVVLGAAVAAWIILSGGDDAPAQGTKHKAQGTIREVTPAPAPKAESREEKIRSRKRELLSFVTNATPAGLDRQQAYYWKTHHMPPAGYTNNSALTIPKEAYEIFTHPSENRIAMYLTIEPGTTLVGTPVFGKRFEEDFLRSCEEPILADPNDTPEQAALRKTMTETKIELRNRMAEGEKLSDILLESHKELQRLAQVKGELEQMAKEEIANAESPEAADDVIAAVNKMLEEKGAAPIKVNPVVRRAIHRRILRKGNNR